MYFTILVMFFVDRHNIVYQIWLRSFQISSQMTEPSVLTYRILVNLK